MEKCAPSIPLNANRIQLRGEKKKIIQTPILSCGIESSDSPCRNSIPPFLRGGGKGGLQHKNQMRLGTTPLPRLCDIVFSDQRRSGVPFSKAKFFSRMPLLPPRARINPATCIASTCSWHYISPDRRQFSRSKFVFCWWRTTISVMIIHDLCSISSRPVAEIKPLPTVKTVRLMWSAVVYHRVNNV